MEKSKVRVDSNRLSDADSLPAKNTVTDETPANWHPGYRARFPRLGIGALVGVLLSAGAAVVVLVCSDRRSSSQWTTKLAPNVCLSAINSFSNVMLGIAITEGVARAWWRKAMKGATVAELHRSWEFAMSSTSILRDVWSLDAIALAALATKLAIVDGVVFQRATSTYTTQDPPRNVTLLGAAATEFPQTGFVLSQAFGAQTDCSCFMIGDTYTPVADAWETSNGFYQGLEELFPTCDGICFSYVEAIGFEIDCTSNVNHTDIATSPVAAFEAHTTGQKGDSSQWTVPIFNNSFGFAYPDTTANYSRLMLDLTYFQSDNPSDPSSKSCPGRYSTTQCTLRPAMIRYPVTIINYSNPHITNGVSLGSNRDDTDNTDVGGKLLTYSYSNKQAEGFEVGEYLSPSEAAVINSTTALGGIANALSQYLSSTATVTYDGTALWALKQQGVLAQTMMYGPPNMGSCDCSFRDALSTLVTEINQLTFLTATKLIDTNSLDSIIVNQTTTVPVIGVMDNTTATFTALPTQQVSDAIHYQTHYLYVALGVASMLGCILLILPSFWRYGELGRDVTLGPMEVASAFGAPMLSSPRGNEVDAGGDVNQLIAQVGDRKVQYGFVQERASVAGGAGNRQSVRICMEDPSIVTPVVGAWSNPSSPRIG